MSEIKTNENENNANVSEKKLTDFFNINVISKNQNIEKNKINIKSNNENKKNHKKNVVSSTRATKISKFVTTKENFNRGDILDKYLKIVDNSYIGADGCTNDNSIFQCRKCNLENYSLRRICCL